MNLQRGRGSILFSRILEVCGAVLIVGLVYWFIQTSFAALPVPSVSSVPRGAVRFDPSLDVSKRDAFFHLHPLGPQRVERGIVGRPNPFLPVTSIPTISASSSVSSSLFFP